MGEIHEKYKASLKAKYLYAVKNWGKILENGSKNFWTYGVTNYEWSQLLKMIVAGAGCEQVLIKLQINEFWLIILCSFIFD